MPDRRGISARIEGERWLIVADTHVGLEVELREKGVRIPSQTDRLLGNIVEWAEEEGAGGVVVLGDVKHEIPYIQESAVEVKRFLEGLSARFNEVVLIQGNHDGGLPSILEKLNLRNVKLYDSRGFLTVLEGRRAVLLHGNSKPSKSYFEDAELMVMGHTHPAVSIMDAYGFVTKRPAILKMRVDKAKLGEKLYGEPVGAGEMDIVILPTANHLTVGVDVVSTMGKPFNAPRTLLTYVEPWNIKDRVEVYLTDLTYLGTLDVLESIINEKVDFDEM